MDGGVDRLGPVSDREREARWKLGVCNTYAVCALRVCGYGLKGGSSIPHLICPLCALSVQNIITRSPPTHQLKASLHAQVLAATGHGIAVGKPQGGRAGREGGRAEGK